MNEAAIAQLGPLLFLFSLQAESSRLAGHDYAVKEQIRHELMPWDEEEQLATAISLINEIIDKTKSR